MSPSEISDRERIEPNLQGAIRLPGPNVRMREPGRAIVTNLGDRLACQNAISWFDENALHVGIKHSDSIDTSKDDNTRSLAS